MKLTEAITFKHLIREARKNPEMNEKVSINQRVIDHLEKAGNVPGTDVSNSFVSFTEIDKLGINPNSRFKTPYGIYSYPSFYVVDEVGERKSMSRLPYVGDAKFANIFSVRGNIIDLGNVSSSDLSDLYQRVTELYIKYAGIQSRTNEWKDAIDFLETNVFDVATTYAKIKTNGGVLWWVTKEMASRMMALDSWNTSNSAVSWNKVFIAMGIAGCIDSQGESIIHTNEPTQAVFFSSRAIADVQRHYNSYSPVDVKAGIAKGEDNIRRIEKNKQKKQYYKDLIEKLENSTETEISEYMLSDIRETSMIISEPMAQDMLANSNSVELKKWAVYASILYGRALQPANTRFIQESIAPDLSEQDVAFIANSMVNEGRGNALHILVSLKDNMNLNLINDNAFEEYSMMIMKNGIQGVLMDMLDTEIFKKNFGFVKRLIENSLTGLPELSQLIEKSIEKNTDLRSDYEELYNLSVTYIDKRLEDEDIENFTDYMEEVFWAFNGLVDNQYIEQLERDLSTYYRS